MASPRGSSSREKVNVRELRQNLSVYLRRVKAGEVLEVAERGTAVAMLAPLPADRPGALARLIAEGKAVPGRSADGLLGAPLPAPRGRALGEALIEERSERS